MGNAVADFSNFVLELHARTRAMSPDALANWAVSDLSDRIGYDCAWFGWARIDRKEIRMFANAPYNLPSSYYDVWKTILRDDLLAKAVAESRNQTGVYDRRQQDQKEGMIHLCDSFDIGGMACAMRRRPGRIASFFLSAYRGRNCRPWTSDEITYLRCAVDHLSETLKAASDCQNQLDSRDRAEVLVNADGICILGLGTLRDRFADLFPGWQSDKLPDSWASLITRPGRHLLADRGVVVTSGSVPCTQFIELRRLNFARTTPLDKLSLREKLVAGELAVGRSRKETALRLGVAPSTVRNQTQSIYEKLGIDNRISLARLLQTYEEQSAARVDDSAAAEVGHSSQGPREARQ